MSDMPEPMEEPLDTVGKALDLATRAQLRAVERGVRNLSKHIMHNPARALRGITKLAEIGKMALLVIHVASGEEEGDDEGGRIMSAGRRHRLAGGGPNRYALDQTLDAQRRSLEAQELAALLAAQRDLPQERRG